MPADVHEPNPNENYYAWKPEHLVHLSTGALIINPEGMILVMYLERVDGKYFLPTKTHKPGNTLEQTLAEVSTRIGWEIEIQSYLGVTTGEFPVPEGHNVSKSVIWYRCVPVKQIERDPEDRDADAEVRWKTREELMQVFEGQAGVSSDVDQRKVLELLEG